MLIIPHAAVSLFNTFKWLFYITIETVALQIRICHPNGFDIFDAIGDFFGSLFQGIGNLFHDIGEFIGGIFNLKTIETILQITVSCLPGAWMFLMPVVSAMITAAAGGDFLDVMREFGVGYLSILTWHGLGDFTSGMKGFDGMTKSCLLHGALGGSLNTLYGGSFKDGFIAGAIGDVCSGHINNIDKDNHCFSGDLERASAAGVVGGTVAMLTGGNFLDGARTAAFTDLYNRRLHNVTIEMQRIDETENSTISEFTATGPNNETVSGYMLEPGGPSTSEANQNQRIPAGTYDITPRNSRRHPNSFAVTNEDVPLSRHILIHSGNTFRDTQGCLIAGSDYNYNGNYFIERGTSRPMMQSLRNLIGHNRATLTIYDIDD